MTCYYPSRTLSPDDVPCASANPDSHCCGKNDTCLDNGYCFGGNIISRGSCTDSTFTSKACPQVCTDVFTGGGVPIYLAIAPYKQPNSFCCGTYNSSSGFCDTATEGSNTPFILPVGKAIVNRTDGSISVSSTQAAQATAFVTDTADADNRATVVSTAVGIPLGILFLMALAALFYQRRLYRRKEVAFLRERQDMLERFSAPPPMQTSDAKHDYEQQRLYNPTHELDTRQSMELQELGVR